MTGGGDRVAPRTTESVQLIFPLVAEPARRPGWAVKALGAGLITAMLVVAVSVAVHQSRNAPAGSKTALVAAGVDDRPLPAEFRSRPRASVFALEPGTCLTDIGMRQDVRDVPVVSCEVEHRAEVIETVQMPDGGWPGRVEVDAFAVEECVPAIFEAGIEPRGDLKWSYFGPSESSWTVRRDRTVSCVVVSDDPRTGSLIAGADASS